LVINPNGLVAVRGNWPALCGSFCYLKGAGYVSGVVMFPLRPYRAGQARAGLSCFELVRLMVNAGQAWYFLRSFPGVTLRVWPLLLGTQAQR
ncbi:hypothetical protein XF29_16725, partial [Escherichia coli]